jgi:thymidylate synthase (FAD)
MNVKLISYTRPSVDLMSDGIGLPIDLISYCARVSNPANQHNTDTSEKLIKYLIKNKHWSPLEMVDVTLEIETTRDIARQILRHRSFTFQEFSQRYAVADLGHEFRDARLQDNKNRQNSIENTDEHLNNNWLNYQQKVLDTANEAYNWAINNGIAKEVARAVLPEGMTLSRMYMKGSLRSWIHYIELRSGNGTQKEHREIAKEAAKVISDIFPTIINLTMETNNVK